MIRPSVSFWSRVCTILVLLGFSHAATAHRDGSEEYRAFWVTAFNTHYRTSAEITAMIDQVRAANLNSIIVQVRKRGDAYYNSHFEPKPTDVAANFDPLADIIAKAHDTTDGKQRIEVHAWIVSYHIWNSTNKPAQPNHPYNLHPDWLSKTESGQMFDGNYTFDQGHPGVQEHTFNVAMDLVSNYDIDGLNFDYVRYSGTEWGYNDITVSRFNEQFSRTGIPRPSDESWKQFRRDQVTGLLRKIYLHTMATKPHVKISVDAITFAPGITNTAQWTSSAAWSSVLQDWRGWMEEGMIDLAIPMNYFRHHESARALDYRRWSDFIKDHQYNRHAIIGPGTYLNYATNALIQMRMTREPSPSGNYAQGLAGYVLGVPTIGDVPDADFFAALTQPGITDSAGNLIDPSPTPMYANRATIPPMPWKVSPTKGHIKGFVYGGANKFDGAAITLSNPTSKTITNDATGFYGFVDVAPGTYTLTARAPGYGILQTNVSVTAGVVTTADLHLRMPDDVFPQISSVTATNVGAFTATIYWTTDERANSVVEFGTNETQLTNIISDAAHVRVHSVDLSGLSPLTGYYFRVRSSDPSGNETVSETYAFSTFHEGHVPDLIIDNPDALVVGRWSTGSGATDKYGDDYRFKSPGSGASYLEYRPNITKAGSYAVYAWFPQGPNRPLNAPYVIGNASGTTTIRVNQQINGGQWNNLGTFNFSAGSDGYVLITDAHFGSGSPQVMADAIKFASVPPPVDLIIDNSQADLEGDWNLASSSASYASDYSYALASSVGNPTHIATYTPEIAVPGRYNVYAFFSGNTTRSSRVPLTIVHAEGTIQTTLNQTINHPGWRKIASNLLFNVGSEGYVEVANDTGENIVVSKAVIADAFRFSLAEPPSILLNPVSKTVTNGGSASFFVEVYGGGPLFYQWKRNGENIPGATNSTLTFTNLTMYDSGSITVEVTNESGAIVSTPATLLVKFAVPPKILSIGRLPDGRLEFRGKADNARFFIDVSTNLVQWDTVSSVISTDGNFAFSDMETNLPARYYRMRWQP